MCYDPLRFILCFSDLYNSLLYSYTDKKHQGGCQRRLATGCVGDGCSVCATCVRRACAGARVQGARIVRAGGGQRAQTSPPGVLCNSFTDKKHQGASSTKSACAHALNAKGVWSTGAACTQRARNERAASACCRRERCGSRAQKLALCGHCAFKVRAPCVKREKRVQRARNVRARCGQRARSACTRALDRYSACNVRASSVRGARVQRAGIVRAAGGQRAQKTPRWAFWEPPKPDPERIN